MDIHAEWRRFEAAYRYQPKYSKEVEQHYLKYLVRLLRAQGYTVLPCGHNGHWDMTLASNGQTLRVEVKIARPKAKPGRSEYYQFKLKSGGVRPVDGDILIACCCPNGPPSMVVYIVPTEDLGDRSTLEITSNPADYIGQWSVYHNAWSILHEQLGGKNA